MRPFCGHDIHLGVPWRTEVIQVCLAFLEKQKLNVKEKHFLTFINATCNSNKCKYNNFVPISPVCICQIPTYLSVFDEFMTILILTRFYDVKFKTALNQKVSNKGFLINF